LSLLSPDELPVWHAERDRAEAEGLLFMAHPLHCAVGTKPGYRFFPELREKTFFRSEHPTKAICISDI